MRPIIFIHNRNSDYLPISLWKARETNPGADVILLGDWQNAHFGLFTHHASQHRYAASARTFENSFVNFSTNPHQFELICLQRWMILESFLKENRIEECLYIDSDVLLFDEIESDANRFSKYGMTVAGISGHTCFVSGTETLGAFCNHIREAYKDEKAIKILEEKYAEFRKTHEAGGISDMTFFTEFRQKFPDQILDIGVPIDQRMFDITITYTSGLQQEHGIKKLEWRNGKPFVSTLSGEESEMRSLHFQGASKQYMLDMAAIPSSTFRGLYATNRAYLLAQKIYNKLIP